MLTKDQLKDVLLAEFGWDAADEIEQAIGRWVETENPVLEQVRLDLAAMDIRLELS
jgi:hypothetical protein